jgi:hypothetical protein
MISLELKPESAGWPNKKLTTKAKLGLLRAEIILQSRLVVGADILRQDQHEGIIKVVRTAEGGLYSIGIRYWPLSVR